MEAETIDVDFTSFLSIFFGFFHVKNDEEENQSNRSHPYEENGSEEMILLNRIGYLLVGMFSLLTCFILIRKLVFYLTWRSFRDGSYVIGLHQWRPGNLAGPHWCNICESIVYGIRSYVVTCDICGMYAHAQCAAMQFKFNPVNTGTNKTCCKVPAVSEKKPNPIQDHLWIKGNLDPMDTCSICGLFCGSILALSGMKCAWCHMRVHQKCFRTHVNRKRFLQECDFGRHRKLILPPSCVLIKDNAASSSSSITSFSRSQRALSSVRSAAQVAVNKMSNIRLRRNGSSTTNNDQIPPASQQISKVSEEFDGFIGEICDIPPAPRSLPIGLGNSSSSCSNFSSTTSRSSSTFTSEAIDHPNVKDPVDTTALATNPHVPFEIDPPAEITPLLVFVNSRSGGKMGIHLLRQIRKWLNPIQVYDLSQQSPIAPLLQFKNLPRLRILVCGGDGTVGWILGALDEIGAIRQPPIAILPLGTGNDLARVLGWGGGFNSQEVSDILNEIEQAHVSLLDRWQVNLNGKKRAVMNNYLGVGVDAQVALEFHEQREQTPGLFMSQFVNKLWYSQFGAKNFLVRTCAGLPTKIELYCDEQLILLPEGTEGIILLNINSYGGGSTLWHHDESEKTASDSESESSDSSDSSESLSEESEENERDFHTEMDDSVEEEEEEETTCTARTKSSTTTSSNTSTSSRRHRMLPLGFSSPHDGLLDVVAVYGTFHLGQMQVGLSKAVRLCQCKKVSIKLKEKVPIQIDGEPWQQEEPCQMDISFYTQAFMLSRTVQERDFVTKKVGEVLDWAENNGVINSKQRDVLLAEIARRVVDEAIHIGTAEALANSTNNITSTTSSSSHNSCIEHHHDHSNYSSSSSSSSHSHRNGGRRRRESSHHHQSS